MVCYAYTPATLVAPESGCHDLLLPVEVLYGLVTSRLLSLCLGVMFESLDRCGNLSLLEVSVKLSIFEPVQDNWNSVATASPLGILRARWIVHFMIVGNFSEDCVTWVAVVQGLGQDDHKTE